MPMSTLKNAVGAEDHVEGSESAKVTLVEYGDYECPHCASANPIVKKVQKHYGEKLRFVFRDFPLSQIHPNAESAAEVSEFAASKGKYWEMHDLLFENYDQLGDDLYRELAADLSLDGDELAAALEAETFTEHVRHDFSGGVRSGVNGTPTFFINGQRHNGPFDYESLVKAIDESMAS
jgi:protein-disulfide isomerase